MGGVSSTSGIHQETPATVADLEFSSVEQLVAAFPTGIPTKYHGKCIKTVFQLNDASQLRLVLQNGVDPNVKIYEDKSRLFSLPLVTAAKNGQCEMVCILLDFGADIQGRDYWKETVVHAAVCSETNEILRRLFDHSFDVRILELKSRGYHSVKNMTIWLPPGTALRHAATIKNIEGVKLLLQAGANVGKAAKPLFNLVCEKDDLELLNLLLDHRYSVNKKINHLKQSILHLAVEKYANKVLSSLLRLGVNVNIKDRKLRTPLMCAIKTGNAETVMRLLDAQADANVADKYRQTPLHLCAEKNECSLAPIFIAKGSDVNARNKQRETPLFVAIKMSNLSVIRALLEANADVNLETIHKQTALHHAVRQRNPKLVSALISKGANVNVEDKDKDTPLLIAARLNHGPAAKLLVNVHADVNVTDRLNNSVIHMAAGHRDASLINALLEHGADVNAMNSEQRTPIHECVLPRYQHTQPGEICKCLHLMIMHNANMDIMINGSQVILLNEVYWNMKNSWGIFAHVMNLFVSHGATIDDLFLHDRSHLLSDLEHVRMPWMTNFCQLLIASGNNSMDFRQILKKDSKGISEFANIYSNFWGPGNVYPLQTLAITSARRHFRQLSKGRSIWRLIESPEIPRNLQPYLKLLDLFKGHFLHDTV